MKREHELLLQLIDARTQLLDQQLRALLTKVDAMSAQLDALKAQVAQEITVSQSAVALIGGLAAQIAQLKDDPVALQELSDSLKAQTDQLAAAVSANTAPAPTPAPAGTTLHVPPKP